MEVIYENQFYKLVESKHRKRHSHYKIINSITNKKEYQFECGYCGGWSDDLQSFGGQPFNDIVEDIISELGKKYKVSKYSQLKYQVFVDENVEVKKLESYYDIFIEMRQILGYFDDCCCSTIFFDYETNLIRKQLEKKRKKNENKNK